MNIGTTIIEIRKQRSMTQEDFIEKYQGNYALTEDGVDYLVTPKSIGKYELDTDNFWLTARKGDKDITINIDENRKIFLALYPGQTELDEKGNAIHTSEKLTEPQKEEIVPIRSRALELWDVINK